MKLEKQINPTTIRLTDEENQILQNIPCFDAKGEWKKMGPYYYKSKLNYYEIYDKNEYKQINKPTV